MSRRHLQHFFSLLHVNHVQPDRSWHFNNVISPYYRLYFIDEGHGYLSQYFIHFFEESPHGISLFYNKRTPQKMKANAGRWPTSMTNELNGRSIYWPPRRCHLKK